jgi:hypothetical protein
MVHIKQVTIHPSIHRFMHVSSQTVAFRCDLCIRGLRSTIRATPEVSLNQLNFLGCYRSLSSPTSFVTLWGSFLCYWLVFFITLFQGILLGVLNVGHRPGSCGRLLFGSRSPPSSRLLGPSQAITHIWEWHRDSSQYTLSRENLTTRHTYDLKHPLCGNSSQQQSRSWSGSHVFLVDVFHVIPLWAIRE